MILSVSRRTDIPAFYTEWFFNRLKEGFVLVRNPINYRQVSKVLLSPAIVDCIVFWTKDPTNMSGKLGLLSEYKYYFQITVNPYDSAIERNVPSRERIIEAFRGISNKIGRDKTVWRYDPIILAAGIDIGFHCKQFELLAARLEGYTDRCIISFVDNYKKTECSMKNIRQTPINDIQMTEIGERFAEIARKHHLKIETCSEEIDLSLSGIEHARCIDDRFISGVIGRKISIPKDKNQRNSCGCVAGIDIGAYNTCSHGCLYCYANFSDNLVRNNISKHDPNSPMLVGNVEPGDKITVRKNVPSITHQLDILDILNKS